MCDGVMDERKSSDVPTPFFLCILVRREKGVSVCVREARGGCVLSLRQLWRSYLLNNLQCEFYIDDSFESRDLFIVADL